MNLIYKRHKKTFVEGPGRKVPDPPSLSTQRGFQVRPIRMQVMKKERGEENKESWFLHLSLAPRQPKGSTFGPITPREKKARGKERKETKRGRERG